MNISPHLRTLAHGLCALWLCCGAVSSSAAIAKPGKFEVLAHFDPTVCRLPSSPLTQGLDGNFYGTMAEGGSKQGGCLYRVSPGGDFTLLHEFDNRSPGEGYEPMGDLLLGADGTLMGTTRLSGEVGNGGMVYRASAEGVVTMLHSFGANPLEYKGPTSAPIRASDGRLYGSVAYDSQGNAGGMVYSVQEDGSDLRVLHTFALRRPGDVAGPWGPLIQGADGALYGAAVFGPVVPDGGVASDGAIFRLSLDGDYRVLHTMYVVGDGTGPQGGLVQAADGSLYGVNALYGGDGNIDVRGTLFRLTPGKTQPIPRRFKVLFTGSEFGSGPRWLSAPLTSARDGSLWGVSYGGGQFGGFNGTVYRFTPQDGLQVMHSFSGPDGKEPGQRLTRAADGWFYGVTVAGGRLGGGVAFRIKPD